MQDCPSFQENVSLKAFCTLGIGGPARYFLEVTTIAQMQEAIKACKSRSLPFLVIGKGSNCLFDDRGFNGAVILNKIDFLEKPNEGVYHVGAGYSFALLGVQTARQGWAGLEFASGIPASIGGAVYMNAGANGGETSKYLSSVDFVDANGELHILSKDTLSFAYRSSPFQKMRGAIVGATFTLYHDPEARKRQIDIVNIRKKTQPYGDKSAGCVFLNPACGAAGALIDQCGLKGSHIGGAQVSQLHANFLINADNATCNDMLSLITSIQKHVKETTGTELHSEVRCIPYELESL